MRFPVKSSLLRPTQTYSIKWKNYSEIRYIAKWISEYLLRYLLNFLLIFTDKLQLPAGYNKDVSHYTVSPSNIPNLLELN